MFVTKGPLFRPVNRFGKILESRLTAQSVALEAGFDPTPVSGHSLRAGLATAAAKAGKSERSIMKQTGHRSVSVVRRYIRDAELFDDCPYDRGRGVECRAPARPRRAFCDQSPCLLCACGNATSWSETSEAR